MAGDDGKIGMMEGAYFVSRSSLLTWVNALLATNYEKVEHMCTGVAHLQILDAIFPGEVPLQKANFNAKPTLSYECLGNLKLVQDVFNKKKLGREIPVDKLVKGRYQDNLEFLQWMKAFFDKNWTEGRQYDAVGRREEAHKTYSAVRGKKRALPLRPITNITPGAPAAGGRGESPVVGAKKPTKRTVTAETVPAQPTPREQQQAANAVPQELAAPTSSGKILRQPVVKTDALSSPSSKPPKQARLDDDVASEVQSLRKQLQQARFDTHVQKRQSLFYYGKLRDIGNMIHSSEAVSDPKAVLDKIQGALWSEGIGSEPAAAPAPAPATAPAAEVNPISEDTEMETAPPAPANDEGDQPMVA